MTLNNTHVRGDGRSVRARAFGILCFFASCLAPTQAGCDDSFIDESAPAAPDATPGAVQQARGSNAGSGRTHLPGHVPKWTSRAFERGRLEADRFLSRFALTIARGPDSDRAFAAFATQQQTPGTPQFHHWLRPEEIGERFGASESTIQTVARWLTSEGLRVDGTSLSRRRIIFSGTVAALESALGVEMHEFEIADTRRIATVKEPSVPIELAPFVERVVGLDSPPAQPVARVRSMAPDDTIGAAHLLAPADVATLYDMTATYAAGVNGAGEVIAIVGQSRVDLSDVQAFQAVAGLPLAMPTVVIPPSGLDPGLTKDDWQREMTVDVSRAGSVAPGASLMLVISSTPSGSVQGGVNIAMEYAVDNAVAPIISASVSACEASASLAFASYFDDLMSQAALEGMSVLVAAGDSGVANCEDYGDVTSSAPPIPNVNVYCSTAFTTCVGGTELNDSAAPSTYWSATSGPDLSSLLRYVPEGTWNDPLDGSGKPQFLSGGGGVSAIFAKPAWQTGTGVPADGHRDVPDVSFSASAHDGYVGCGATFGSTCPSAVIAFFGTSAAAPTMAGIVALLDQNLGGPQGNLNPLLYRLAQDPTNRVFHDVTVASSGVADCTAEVPSMCNNSLPSDTGLTGGLAGYVVGDGYDLATGWGSIDVGNLIAAIGCLGRLDGAFCDDGNACTTVDACQSGVCVGSAPYAPAGTSCSDGNACTKNDTCNAAGSCSGTAYSCSAPTECEASRTCDGLGGCGVIGKPLGTACSSDGIGCTTDACDGSGECAHTLQAGDCLIDGACYTTAALDPANPCEGCTPATSTSTWTLLPAGTICHAAAGACDVAESCSGSSKSCPAAAVAPAGTACGADACLDGVASTVGVCDGTSVVCTQPTQACGVYACGATTCKTSCGTSADCIPTAYCVSGACVAKLLNGAMSTDPTRCASGNVADGVCCDIACEAACTSCDLPASVGQCIGVSSQSDPHQVCSGVCNAGTCAVDAGPGDGLAAWKSPSQGCGCELPGLRHPAGGGASKWRELFSVVAALSRRRRSRARRSSPGPSPPSVR